MSSNDQDTEDWKLKIEIDEHDERTRAKARLHWRANKLVGGGLGRRNPADDPVAKIGDELAVARALTDLANQLFALTESDIQAATHEPVTGLHR